MDPQIFALLQQFAVTELTPVPRKICIEDRDLFLYSTLIYWKRQKLHQVNVAGRIDVHFTIRGVEEVEVLEGEPEKPHYSEF